MRLLRDARAARSPRRDTWSLQARHALRGWGFTPLHDVHGDRLWREAQQRNDLAYRGVAVRFGECINRRLLGSLIHECIHATCGDPTKANYGVLFGLPYSVPNDIAEKDEEAFLETFNFGEARAWLAVRYYAKGRKLEERAREWFAAPGNLDGVLQRIEDAAAIGEKKRTRTYPDPEVVARTVSKKIGRNETCVCGSAFKFKDCCATRLRLEKSLKHSMTRDLPRVLLAAIAVVLALSLAG